MNTLEIAKDLIHNGRIENTDEWEEMRLELEHELEEMELSMEEQEKALEHVKKAWYPDSVEVIAYGIALTNKRGRFHLVREIAEGGEIKHTTACGIKNPTLIRNYQLWHSSEDTAVIPLFESYRGCKKCKLSVTKNRRAFRDER